MKQVFELMILTICFIGGIVIMVKLALWVMNNMAKLIDYMLKDKGEIK